MDGRSVLRSLALVAALAGASLALAAPTGASSVHTGFPRVTHVPIPAFTGISAGAAASHGYRFELSGSRDEPLRGEPAGSGSGFLQVTMRKGSTAAQYTVRSGPTPDGAIVASLGSLGRLAVHFVPRQTTERPLTPGCDGRGEIERGVLRGTIAFHGEGGYSDLLLHALKATLITGPEAQCTFHPNRAKTHESHESIRFGGDWSPNFHRYVSFLAEEHPRLGTATLRASSSGRRGPVEINRYAKVVVPARLAPFDQGAGTASVDPPAPFTGFARFRAFPGKEAGTWLGPLAVDLPGEPGIHLAGHRYEGSLLSGGECGPDEPGLNCAGLREPTPIGLGPVRKPE